MTLKIKKPGLPEGEIATLPPPIRRSNLDAEQIEGGLDDSLFDSIKDDIIGAMPLESEQMEKFCQLIALQQLSATRAYTEAYNSKGTPKTRERHAMKLKKREDIQARIDFLGGQVDNVTDHPADLREAIKLCSKIMRSTNKPAELRFKAMEQLGKMLGWYNVKGKDAGDGKPDPAWFARYIQTVAHKKNLTQADGVDPTEADLQ